MEIIFPSERSQYRYHHDEQSHAQLGEDHNFLLAQTNGTTGSDNQRWEPLGSDDTFLGLNLDSLLRY